MKISAYQWMALATCVITTVSITALSDNPVARPYFTYGWAAVSQIEVFLSIQLLALGIIWFMGRSQVTGALVELRLFRERL